MKTYITPEQLVKLLEQKRVGAFSRVNIVVMESIQTEDMTALSDAQVSIVGGADGYRVNGSYATTLVRRHGFPVRDMDDFYTASVKALRELSLEVSGIINRAAVQADERFLRTAGIIQEGGAE